MYKNVEKGQTLFLAHWNGMLFKGGVFMPEGEDVSVQTFVC